MPKFTIITVCYNAAELIAETMKSVLNQDCSDFEYLIVDGASTDNTLSVVNRVLRENTHSCDVKIISEPDNGIYDAMNKGVSMASGDWVNFMNAGDTFVGNDVLGKISVFLGTIETDVKIIGGNTVNVYPNGHTEIHHAEDAQVVPYRLPFSHQACFARIGKEYQWKFNCRYRFAADYDMIHRTWMKFGEKSIRVIDIPIANYRQEDSFSLSPENILKVKCEYLRIQSSRPNWQWCKECIKWFISKYKLNK